MTAPYQTITAVPRGVDAVAALPAFVAPRKLSGITVNAPRGSAIVVYLGAITPSTRIDQNINGYNNTADYPNPRPIPSGQTVICVWPNMGPRAAECSATFIMAVT
jgi:hypothetical protein